MINIANYVDTFYVSCPLVSFDIGGLIKFSHVLHRFGHFRVFLKMINIY